MTQNIHRKYSPRIVNIIGKSTLIIPNDWELAPGSKVKVLKSKGYFDLVEITKLIKHEDRINVDPNDNKVTKEIETHYEFKDVRNKRNNSHKKLNIKKVQKEELIALKPCDIWQNNKTKEYVYIVNISRPEQAPNTVCYALEANRHQYYYINEVEFRINYSPTNNKYTPLLTSQWPNSKPPQKSQIWKDKNGHFVLVRQKQLGFIKILKNPFKAATLNNQNSKKINEVWLFDKEFVKEYTYVAHTLTTFIKKYEKEGITMRMTAETENNLRNYISKLPSKSRKSKNKLIEFIK